MWKLLLYINSIRCMPRNSYLFLAFKLRYSICKGTVYVKLENRSEIWTHAERCRKSIGPLAQRTKNASHETQPDMARLSVMKVYQFMGFYPQTLLQEKDHTTFLRAACSTGFTPPSTTTDSTTHNTSHVT